MNKRYKYLYKITNNVNQKIYVGIHATDDLDDGYLGSGTALRYAKIKYGISNFSKEILNFYDTYDELVQAESEYVTTEFVKDPNTYNLIPGGKYYIWSPHDCLTNSLAQIKYQNTVAPEIRSARMAHMGKKSHWSDEKFLAWRQALSKANTNNINVINANKKIWANMSEETKTSRRQKISHSKKLEYSKLSNDERKQMTAKATLAAKKKIKCVWCGKESSTGNHSRWHGNNCKMKV